ncbi:MAG: hypothetical protein ACLVJ6_06890 [Merdibacter sp.]
MYLGPGFSPYTYDGQDLNAINEMSSLAHPMGTDYLAVTCWYVS